MKKILSLILSYIILNTGFMESVEAKTSNAKVLGTDTGRYVFGQISDFRSDQYLIDTETGRLWQLVVDENKNTKMRPIPIIQLLGEEAYVPEPIERDEQFRENLREAMIKKIEQSNQDSQ